jgi:hypothetical protein
MLVFQFLPEKWLHRCEATLDDTGAKQYVDSYNRVITEVVSVPANLRRSPGVSGVWSLHDLMGHLAYWDEEQAAELRAIASGDVFVEHEGDDINAREVALRAGRSWDEVMAEVNSAHAELVPLLVDPGESRAQYRIHEHWDEHLEHILAWKRSINE